ncbi:MAG: CYTH domain-containing protein [Proteobacteria bacterium]|nr:CYTH domain-containing protein [Desulfobacula sp.]MBU4130697.1 CYTH domain-containing protein [Pseudomonadota bacterium]
MGIEIERKFLVTRIPVDLSCGLFVCQGYMLNREDRVVRIRIMGNSGFLTIKGKTVNTRRWEFEYEIPEPDARQMLELFCEKPLVEKVRFKIEFKGFEWVIDQFLGENAGLVLGEIELEHETQSFEIPPWAGKEVTRDPRYYNSNLICHPYSAW